MTMSPAHRLAIMQPYVFPYIGYFHLIESSESIVFYDDVNFIKRGWINRNRILLNDTDFLITIPVEKASQNKLILDIKPKIDSSFNNKFYGLLKNAYKKAPHYEEVLALINNVLDKQYENIADLAIESILSVYQYLGKEINWTKSSIVSPESKGIDRADRLIHITKSLGYKQYVNSFNGRELYQKEYFHSNGVELYFIHSEKVDYRQYSDSFIPWLSIIDVLMFNDKESVNNHLLAYSLI